MAHLGISLLGTGRMGREILAALAAGAEDLRLAGVWVRPGSADEGRNFAADAGQHDRPVTASSDLAAVIAAGDVAIDFSLPAATPAVLAAAVAEGKPLVCGVSGLDDTLRRQLDTAARSIPLFYDRNMSVGIALMRRMVAEAGRVLGTAADVDIHDLHHAKKLDAPSGTALLLGEALAAARGQAFADVMRYEPDGKLAGRNPGDIVFEARREGEHPGTHTVVFAAGAETLTLRHEVSERRVFADGALRAARWLAGQEAGRYDMQDLLAAELGD